MTRTTTMLLLLALPACGAHPRPWAESAQIALATGAHVLAAGDAVAAARYRLDAADAGALAPLEARYAPVLEGERIAAASLRAAEAALDVYRANATVAAQCRAHAAVLGAAADTATYAAVLRAAGLAVPPEVATLAALAGDVTRAVDPTCAPDGGA